MKYKYLMVLIAVIFLLLPLGVLTNAPAWGEWDLSFYEKVLGFIPDKMKNSINIPAILPDYSLKGLNPIISYYLSALIGAGIIFFAFYTFYKLRR